MNILITYENFNCGGAESRIFTLSKALIERGHRVIILSKYGDYVPLFNKIGGIHHTIDFSDITNLELIINKIREIINIENIEVVHLNPYYSIIAPVFASIYENKPFCITIHGIPKNLKDWSERNSLDFFNYFLENIIFKYSSKIITVSPEVTEYLIKNFEIEMNKIKYIPQFIDIELFKNIDYVENKKKKFLLASRIDDDKILSINEALNFFSFYKSNINDAELDIVGIGNYREKFEILINQKNRYFKNNCIKFLNNKADLWNIINEYDIIIGMGRVVLEGIATNKIVILSGIDGIKGVIRLNNFNKFLKTNFSGRGFLNKSYYEVINEIFKIDEQEILKLKDIVINNFSSNKWIIEYENIYKKSNIYDFNKDELMKFLEDTIEIYIKSKIKVSNELENCKVELNNIYNSKFWKIISIYYKIKEKFNFLFLKKLNFINRKTK